LCSINNGADAELNLFYEPNQNEFVKEGARITEGHAEFMMSKSG